MLSIWKWSIAFRKSRKQGVVGVKPLDLWTQISFTQATKHTCSFHSSNWRNVWLYFLKFITSWTWKFCLMVQNNIDSIFKGWHEKQRNKQNICSWKKVKNLSSFKQHGHQRRKKNRTKQLKWTSLITFLLLASSKRENVTLFPKVPHILLNIRTRDDMIHECDANSRHV